jgi:undecaprenyl-diphosphatase
VSRPVSGPEALARAAAWPLGGLLSGVVVSGTVFALVAAGSGQGTGWIARADTATNREWVAAAVAHPAWADLLRALTFWGNTPVVLTLTVTLVGWQALRHRPLLAGWVAATVLVGWLANAAAKAAVDRPRPPTLGLLADAAGSSFPSGHAQVAGYAWITFGLLALLVVRSRWRLVVAAGCWTLGALVAASRVALGVHWASDVVAGYALGVGVALLSASVLAVTARGRAASVVETQKRDPDRVEAEDLPEEGQLGLQRDDL